MIIPPTSERYVRPCESCHCYYDDDGSIPTCNIEDISVFSKRFDRAEFNDELHKFVEVTPDPTYPCTYHITKDEYREAAESGAFDLRAEPIGNSDELWDWLARRIRNVTYGYQKAADGYYYRDGYHDALEWVLSLKKEGK